MSMCGLYGTGYGACVDCTARGMEHVWIVRHGVWSMARGGAFGVRFGTGIWGSACNEAEVAREGAACAMRRRLCGDNLCGARRDGLGRRCGRE
eukprot:363284-Chlamydomonas_euryale.AAC.1